MLISTEDWQGPERYSLVFFTNHLWNELPFEAEARLRALGFPWPCQRGDVFAEELLWPAERLAAARRSWRRSELLWRLQQLRRSAGAHLQSFWRAFRGASAPFGAALAARIAAQRQQSSQNMAWSQRSKCLTYDLRTRGQASRPGI